MRPNSLLILLSFSSSLLSLACAISLGTSVAAICSHTDYPSVCVDVAQAYSHEHRLVDPTSLLAMHIGTAADRTKVAKAAASRLASSCPAEAAQAIGICIEEYDNALDDLKKGNDAIAASDAGTANSMLSAVITYYSTCDDAFQETPGVANPMEKQDDLLQKTVSNALALAQLVLS